MNNTAEVTPPPLRSRMDDWQGWPENSPNFDPVFGHLHAKHVRGCFCPDPECDECTRSDVVQIVEYDAEGNCLLDTKLGPRQLEAYLRTAELNASAGVPLAAAEEHNVQATIFRFFLFCTHRPTDCISYPYARQVLSFCRAPVDVAQAFGSCTHKFDHGFYQHPGRKESVFSDHHSWLVIRHIMSPEELLEEPEDIQRNAFYGVSLNPQHTVVNVESAMYIAKDLRSGRSNIVLDANASAVLTMRLALTEYAALAAENPFVLMACYLGCILRLQQHVVGLLLSQLWWPLDGIDGEQYLRELRMYNETYLSTTHSHAAMRHLHLAVSQTRLRHGLFADKHDISESSRALVESLLDKHEVTIAHLIEDYDLHSKCIKGQIDGIAGASQVRSGVGMYRMGRDNQKQAEATEALARESKRDSEVMKTITVVTLVYLPATFVCTLLSMGLFDFNVGENGRLQIARQGWIFLAITLPLTIITLGLAYGWQRRKEKEASAAAAAKKTVEHAADDEHTAENYGGIAAQIGAVPAPGDGEAAPTHTTSSRSWMRMLPLRRRKAAPTTGETMV
ncbi:hypothetical protein EXIGLDRAFT_767524 [Exidia glandulosa HHB12029]|uniref:Cora-domain-containing protein n=1 Tax=Exidia glandulosa HHB12029 TaxID=1314781 RepID=A0A165IWK6_EXIGL|nr:hypothetical protein EXIGLDRAFT_767524 [Exidia glandulosa HHB12029]